MSELFSEIYGCYYRIAELVLNKAKQGISRNEICEIINKHGFSETEFHLLHELIGEEWRFLEKQDDKYFSVFSSSFSRPYTTLELSYIKSLISDSRFKLFLTKEKTEELLLSLKDIEPLFFKDDFISIDKHLDGDNYQDENYISNFREILKAIKNNYPLSITYESEKKVVSKRICHPYKLSYSELNDKFRLLSAVYNSKTSSLNKIVLNMQRIVSAEPADSCNVVSKEELNEFFFLNNKNPPIVVEITKERNSLERFLLQFASFYRKTEYDQARDKYICQIYYELNDETELLIRILSFGPTVKVLGPESFLIQLKDRIRKQMRVLGIN